MSNVDELNQEVTRLMHDMLEACAKHLADQTPETFRAWKAATAAYITKHREWFAVAMPDLDYDAVYGA